MTWTHLHSACAAALFFVAAGFWTANNIVFASDYSRYQKQQELRWLQYDERQLYRDYREMMRIRNKTHADRQRLADLEHEMELKRSEIRAARR